MTAAGRALTDRESARDRADPGPAATARPAVAPAFQVTAAGDREEQEADRMAEAVLGRLAGPAPAGGAGPIAVRAPSPLSRIQRAAVRMGAGGGPVDEQTGSALHRAQGAGRPLDTAVRREFEGGFGADLSGVRVHDDPAAHALSQTLNAHAFTTGRDIFFAAGAYAPTTTGGRWLLAHELGHVVQHGTGTGAPIHRLYAGLTPMGQRRVDQTVDNTYHDKALAFELGMARRIEADPQVNAIADLMVGRVKAIVDAWAVHTARSKAHTYVREFGWPPGDNYYGAFEMTADAVNVVLAAPGTKPLRTKLKLIYNAVRNNNLAKWLKVAAIELDRAARGQVARSWHIRSSAEYVESRPGHPRRLRTETVDDTVTTGFAAASGLTARLTAQQKQDLAATATQERQTVNTGAFWATPREVFDRGRFGAVLAWKPEARKANEERRAGASQGLRLDQQRTLTVADVPDLTDEEADLILKRQNNHTPDAGARLAYRGVPGNRVPWSQGGEFFDVTLGSDSATAAAQVKARLEAGISGSTDLMLHACEYLGVVPGSNVAKALRLGLAGWMIANRDHSFYEVFKAAVPYGLPFTVNPLAPGAEYVLPDHLIPMQPTDFDGILPNDGPLNNVFPGDYHSVAYKDHLANALLAPGTTNVQIVAALKLSGLSSTVLSTMVDRDLAALQDLDALTQAQPINPLDPMPVRTFAARRIRLHPSYVYLGNTYGSERASLILDALLRHHHPLAGVARTDPRSILLQAGVAETVLNSVDAVNLGRIEALRQAVIAAPAVANPLAMVPINGVAATIAGLSTEERDGLKWSLIATFKPAWARGVAEQGLLDISERRAQIEQIAQLVRTTGVWYSWGDPVTLNGYANAPSLRERTRNVPSTQGPGMYIGREVSTSAGYGDRPGQRCLVIKLANVPTIDGRNAQQRERLRLLQPRGGSVDVLEASYLYDRNVSVEILMIYGGGNFARLTTNRGVTLTLDLRHAPADHLRAKYQNVGLWPGASRANLLAQANANGVNTGAW